MKLVSILIQLVMVIIASCGVAQTSGCEVPDGMTKAQKILCIRAASIMLDQPALSPVQVSNGPDFDATQPDKSRFAYFTDSDTISCYFRPHTRSSKYLEIA